MCLWYKIVVGGHERHNINIYMGYEIRGHCVETGAVKMLRWTNLKRGWVIFENAGNTTVMVMGMRHR